MPTRDAPIRGESPLALLRQAQHDNVKRIALHNVKRIALHNVKRIALHNVKRIALHNV